MDVMDAVDPNHINRPVEDLLGRIRERSSHAMQEHIRFLWAEYLRNLWLNHLVDFFVSHPNFFYDLERKIHKHSEKIWWKTVIPKEKEEEIFSIFLRFASFNSINLDNIEWLIREEIFGNQKLIITLSWWNISLLDTSHGDVQRLVKEWKTAPKTRINFIASAIRNGMQVNNQAIKADISQILPKLQLYLTDIFDISYEFKWIHNIHGLAEWVYHHIDTWEMNGLDAKKAWMLIKAFTAWSAIMDIEKIHEKWKEYLETIPSRLSNADWITLENIGQSGDDWVFTGNIVFNIHGNSIPCIINYRLKSIRSILLKMWENADYNTIDAMRDIIGIAIVFPPNTDEVVRTEIIKKMNSLFMLPRQYMFKNKGLIEGKESTTEILNNPESPPLNQRAAISRNKKTTSKFINASASGFSCITEDNNSENIIGCEIQYYTPEWYEFWKVDHYLYDPLKVMSAWSRGSWFLTPHQAINCIEQEISTDVIFNKFRRTNGFKHLDSPQGILYDYLKKGSLLVFLDSETQGVYIVPLDHAEAFTNKFKSRMRRIHIRTGQTHVTHWWDEKREIDEFRGFIDSLKTGKWGKKSQIHISTRNIPPKKSQQNTFPPWFMAKKWEARPMK